MGKSVARGWPGPHQFHQKGKKSKMFVFIIGSNMLAHVNGQMQSTSSSYFTHLKSSVFQVGIGE